jgi:peptidoglycan/xylan/chitin deacetylase (PgdA/CDA1 family)
MAGLPNAVMWHYVRLADAVPRTGYRGVTPEAFETQLDSLCERWTPVGWPAVLASLAGDSGLPRDAMLLTFDDGFVDHHRVVLPALLARGLSGVFFVLARRPGDSLTVGHALHVLLGIWSPEKVRAEVLERLSQADRERCRAAEGAPDRAPPDDPDDIWKRPLQRDLAPVAGPILRDLVDTAIGPESDVADALHLSPDQLRDLVDAGMTLGGHGRTHPWLDAIDDDRRRDEIAASTAFLTRFQVGPWPFAYPYGAAPSSAPSLLADAGFAAGFTTTAAERSDRFHIGRVDGDDAHWLTALPPGRPA